MFPCKLRHINRSNSPDILKKQWATDWKTSDSERYERGNSQTGERQRKTFRWKGNTMAVWKSNQSSSFHSSFFCFVNRVFWSIHFKLLLLKIDYGLLNPSVRLFPFKYTWPRQWLSPCSVRNKQKVCLFNDRQAAWKSVLFRWVALCFDEINSNMSVFKQANVLNIYDHWEVQAETGQFLSHRSVDVNFFFFKTNFDL